MRELAARLANVPVDQHVFIASNILGKGMMRPQLWMRAIVTFAAWWKGHPKSFVWANVMAKDASLAAQTIAETATWIVSGKDVDGEGVGGLNEREVGQMVRILGAAETAP